MSNEINKSLGFVIHDVARLMRWQFDRRSQGLGLTRSQWSVLAYLNRCDGGQQKTLACLMDIKPITLARHLDRLEADGWVQRRDDPDDRRAKRIFLTDKARPVLEKLRELGQGLRGEAMAGISREEEETFLRVLLQMRENLAVTPGNAETTLNDERMNDNEEPVARDER